MEQAQSTSSTSPAVPQKQNPSLFSPNEHTQELILKVSQATGQALYGTLLGSDPCFCFRLDKASLKPASQNLAHSQENLLTDFSLLYSEVDTC